MSNATLSTDAFRQKLHSAHQRVDEALNQALQTLPFSDMPLSQAMRYGALLGGKRLRPFLVYAVGEMFNVPVANLDVPAAAIECIHAYSLIHDDLPAMDNDDLRRGKPTCHIEFGEANAILAGDALQTLAFEILAKNAMPDVAIADRVAMIAELATASGLAGMCPVFCTGITTLPAPPLCSSPSLLGKTARRLTVPVERSMTPLIDSICPCSG